MTGLLFGLLYWLAIGWAACGVVVITGFVWFTVSDWLDESRWREDEQRVSALISPPPTDRMPPYDWNDPFERWFLLPDAPEPKWLVG